MAAKAEAGAGSLPWTATGGSPRRVSRSVYGYLFIAPFFIAFAVFHLYPILYSLYLSFTTWDGFTAPEPVGFENYERLLRDDFFYKAVGTTLIIWSISIVPQLVLALTLAIVLHQKFVRGKHLFRAVYYFPNIVTPVTIGMLFSLLFDWQTGAVNRVLTGLNVVAEPVDWLHDPTLARLLVAGVMCWQWFGYNVLIYTAGLQGISEEVLQAAEVDGASRFRVARDITIPLLRPVILFTVITSIIGGMQIFDVPLTLVGKGPEESTQTIVMYLYETAFTRFDYGYGATIAYAAFVLIAVFSLLTFWATNRRRGA